MVGMGSRNFGLAGSRTRVAAWLVAVLMAVGAGDAALARSEKRQGDAVNAKIAAPTQEDHAAYFSEKRGGVSPEALDKADKLRRKTIASIQDLLKSKKKNVRRFELLLRMGELYVERHDYVRDQEMDSYTKAWDAWSKDKKGQEPKAEFGGSEAEMVKAANAFRQLVSEFPKHPRTDAALYSLARTLARLGKDTAVDYYKQMIQSFPKSPLIADAYLSLGEYYFDKHDIPSAMTYYKKVMDFKTHRAYPYAVYKLGWAFYNAPAKNEGETRENNKKAVAAFKLVVKLSDADKERGRRDLDLRDEAIRDLIMVWADAEDVASAWKYFKTIGEQDSFYKMLERLGNIYTDQGKNGQAIAVFQRLLKDAPRRENNPAVHAKLLELYDLVNQVPQVVAEVKNMHRLYLGDSAWVKANAKSEGAAAEADRLVELHTHRWGAMFHQRGQKMKSDEYLKYSAEVYRQYLSSFATSPNAYEIRYYLAEILYDFKQWEEASDHYLIVAKADKNGKYAKTAAVNAVGAMNQLVASKTWPALPPAGQVPKPIEIPSVKQKFVKVIDAYVALQPKEKDGEAMRFTAAQTYFDYGHYDVAIERYAKLTREIPETKQARASVRLVLGYYADKEDWNKMIAWSQTFTKTDKLLDAELKKWVVDLLRSAMFKRALTYEKAQKYERAAHSFLEFQKEFPADTNADRAVYNAMLNFFRVGRVENAVATGGLLLDKYPQSELVPDTLANVGQTHESLARFEEAAAMYKRLAMNHQADKRAPNAMFNAAVLYRGLKKTDESVALLTTFGQRYPDNQLAPEATLTLAELHERAGRWADAQKAYATYAAKYRGDVDANLMAQAKSATIRVQYLDREPGLKDLDNVRKALTAKGAPGAMEARAAVAGTLFKLAEPAFVEFMATKIADGSKIEQEVTAKQQRLERLANAYEQVIDLGSGEFTVASLYRLGEAHENFSTALFRAPAPKGASQAEFDKLKTELEKVAFQLKEEAYKFFETAYRRSKEVETFTAWTRRTYQKMVELAPEKHPAVNELSAEPAYLSHDVKLSKPVAELAPEAEE
jgi:TolA-binding protein